MKARLLLALLLPLAALAFAPAPFPRPQRRGGDDNEISLARFQGLWRVASFANSRSNGDHTRRDWHIKYIRVRDSQWSFMTSETATSVNYTIEISQGKPAQLDFYGSPRLATETTPRGVGIIRREGTKVTIIYIFGASRAVSFEQPPDNQYVIQLELAQR